MSNNLHNERLRVGLVDVIGRPICFGSASCGTSARTGQLPTATS